MKQEHKLNLSKKGWSQQEIEKAEKIIEERVLHDKSGSRVNSARVLFWGIFFIIIIGNIFLSMGLIPLLLVFNRTGINITIIILGFLLGLFFNFLIWDIEENLTKKHHVLAATLIPLLSVINLFFITKITNGINNVFRINETVIDPITMSALYVMAFLTPYLWTLFVKKKIKRY